MLERSNLPIEEAVVRISPTRSVRWSELRDAFDSVLNPEQHWKGPIDTVLRVSDEELLREAIVFYTGSVPTFRPIGEGYTRVTAKGYWQAVGA